MLKLTNGGLCKVIEKHVIILSNGNYCYEVEMCVFTKDSYNIKNNRFSLGVCHYPAYESHMRKYELILYYSTLHELDYAYVKKVEDLQKRGYE